MVIRSYGKMIALFPFVINDSVKLTNIHRQIDYVKLT